MTRASYHRLARLPVLSSAFQASGRAWVAVAKYEGSDIIRLTHGETTPADVIELVHTLQRANATKARSDS
jgi:hypothetical protein